MNLLIKAMTCAALVSALASCGGGSDTPGNTSPTATITSISPVGVIAQASPQPLSILGTNFANGMTVSVTDHTGAINYTVNSVSVSSATVITANVIITTVPTDNYVNVTIKSSSGTPLATSVIGVAGANRTLLTDVQPILDSKCGTCHTGTNTAYLDMSSYAATSSSNPTGLIGIPSQNCSQRFRIVPGDPRRSSSVLIDKIKAATSAPAACSGGQMPPVSSPQLSNTEIQTIIDWVALGAN